MTLYFSNLVSFLPLIRLIIGGQDGSITFLIVTLQVLQHLDLFESILANRYRIILYFNNLVSFSLSDKAHNWWAGWFCHVFSCCAQYNS